LALYKSCNSNNSNNNNNEERLTFQYLYADFVVNDQQCTHIYVERRVRRTIRK